MTLCTDSEFGSIPELIHQHALHAPQHRALLQGERSLDYAALDALMDRTAAALQRDGIGAGQVIAICAAMSIEYAAVFLGALRAGVAVAPLAPGSGASSLQRMLQDAQARLLFTDAANAESFGATDASAVARVALDGSPSGRALADWLAANAGNYKKVAREAAAPPQDRISQSAWFVREHREITSAVWKRPAVGSAAQCAACHRGAEAGRFSEHDVKVPQ